MKNILKLILSLFFIYTCSGQNKQTNVYKLPKDSYVIDSVIIELNLKTLKVITLEKKKNKSKDNSDHFSCPIIILHKNNSNYYELVDNSKLVYNYNDNCPAGGYEGIVSKNNYFTIEQMICVDFKFTHTFTTFKIDEITGEIYLHKHGEKYTERSNPNKIIKDNIWTRKDFGELKFESVTQELLNRIRQNNPKK